MSHRIKNIFAAISGLIGLSAQSSPAIRSYAVSLRDRVLALGRAHDFVGPQGHIAPPSQRKDSLHGLLQEIFSPYENDVGARVHIEGEDVAIDDRSATPLALSFHELVTNAAKYGSLSGSEGDVLLAIQRLDDAVEIVWRERGGPAVSADVRNPAGFGSRLIDLSLRRQLGGQYEQIWDREGLTMRLSIPNSALIRPSG